MTKNGKAEIIAELAEKFGASNVFYLTDSSTLTVEDISKLRRECFNKDVQVKVAKNTLIKRALEAAADGGSAYSDLYETLKGPTTIIFSEVSNLPAKIIKDFRKTSEKPVLKAAFIDPKSKGVNKFGKALLAVLTVIVIHFFEIMYRIESFL